jgi:hypothetical protein
LGFHFSFICHSWAFTGFHWLSLGTGIAEQWGEKTLDGANEQAIFIGVNMKKRRYLRIATLYLRG